MTESDLTTDELEFEKTEWIESLDSLIESDGAENARLILQALDRHAKEIGLVQESSRFSPYRNTIAEEQQPKYPGDIDVEERITAILRWNALAMVMRANQAYGELGGHIASYASVAEIFEMGFNHFFRGGNSADLVYFQPHSAPGIYARAYLEGRLDAQHLAHYRQETSGHGLCSYPHPWLMPDFWQFPTGSMGIGPINAIYNARFMKYLDSRGFTENEGRKVWGVFGDGEMDEPESLAALSLAAREKLDNLTFIINCNLQRLDGPVRGNGQIIPELESIFQGAGWNVIKVLWGSEWDALFAKDTNHALLRRFAATVDGKYQTLGANDGEYNLKHFFAEDPEVMKLVEHMTDAEIDGLRRGGHDVRKLYAAFSAANDCLDRPTVILAKTKKGFGMGEVGESRMTSHQTKKLGAQGLLEFRDRFSIPMSDKAIEDLEFYCPDSDSAEMKYLLERRRQLGGSLPKRLTRSQSIEFPPLDSYAGFVNEPNDKGGSTTMAFVRMLGGLLRNEDVGPRVVPIVADEARTFGMANLFRQIGIYSPGGQLYEPEDSASLLAYREQENGQLLEEGISEAGALASWTAAATSYSTHNVPMLSVYIYYSMFGFQRVGDMIWAAADQRARGFLIGATAGKTTLSGEGLQHQDGNSHVIAAMVPNCRSYDPCYAYELAVIFDYGSRRIMRENIDEFYYITVMNENYPQPKKPSGIEDDIVKGMYLLSSSNDDSSLRRVQLMGSGTILREVEAAARILEQDYQIVSDIWSVTSFTELARDGDEVERYNRYNPKSKKLRSHVDRLLSDKQGPVVAATDYVKQYPNQIRGLVKRSYTVLGTDGFGMSDTRQKLRKHFMVDRHSIIIAALYALLDEGEATVAEIEAASTSREEPLL